MNPKKFGALCALIGAAVGSVLTYFGRDRVMVTEVQREDHEAIVIEVNVDGLSKFEEWLKEGLDLNKRQLHKVQTELDAYVATINRTEAARPSRRQHRDFVVRSRPN